MLSGTLSEGGVTLSLTEELLPVPESERIQSLDILRGFALFGILLVNIEGIVGPLTASLGGTDLSLANINRWADAGIYILAQGKFYTIFSLLFGMGFGIVFARAQAAGRSFSTLFLRRLAALAIIGLMHAILVRAGDILVAYAVFGLFLFLFRNTPQSRLPGYGLFLYFAPVVLTVMAGYLMSLVMADPVVAAQVQTALQGQQEAFSASIAAQRAAFGAGSYPDAVAQSIADFRMVWSYMFIAGWQILGLFVLGLWFIRSGAIADPHNYPGLYAFLRWVGLPLGLVLMVTSFVMLPENEFNRMDLPFAIATALNLTGSLFMSLGYVAIILRGLASSWWAPRLKCLAPAGRMALTNYLLQSVVGALIFNNYGLGFYEQLSRGWQIPFTIALFALQVVFSQWWLSHFRFGPAEWLWRAATYLRLPPMRKAREFAPPSL